MANGMYINSYKRDRERRLGRRGIEKDSVYQAIGHRIWQPRDK